jgi:hypothetical protein
MGEWVSGMAQCKFIVGRTGESGDPHRACRLVYLVSFMWMASSI